MYALIHLCFHQLLAYQKSKKRKKKRRPDGRQNSGDHSEPLSSSFSLLDEDTSEATLPHSGNTSPIPLDDLGVPRGSTQSPSISHDDVSLIVLDFRKFI